MYDKYAEAMDACPQIIFCKNREIFGYLKSLSRDRWYHMKITEDHKLLKLGWTNANFWDSVFDSIASSEPTVKLKEKTNGNLFFSNVLSDEINDLMTIKIIVIFLLLISSNYNRRIITCLTDPTQSDKENPPVIGAAIAE